MKSVEKANYMALVGREVQFIPSYRLGTKDELEKNAVYGAVVWVHPRGRYFMAEYTVKNGCVLRECLPLPQCLHLVKR